MADTRPVNPLVRGVRQAIVLALLMGGSFSCYLLILRLRGPAGVERVTWIHWDDWFPFEPAWTWVYLVPYLIGPLLAALLRPEVFRWFAIRSLIVVAITLVIFIIFPTHTKPRENIPLGDSLTAALYRMMVEIDDPPANAAPSLHVSLTCMLALALARNNRSWAAPAFLGAGLVWLATLMTRQHHLIDVVTGAALALLVALPFGRKHLKEDNAP